MGRWLRRARGAIGIGLIWGFVCSLAGGIPRWIFGINTDAPMPIIFGAFGFFAGVTFSVVLALVEGRRRFDEMSVPRFAAWGASGGLLLSALFMRGMSLSAGEIIAIPTTFALASAACAAGSLALARRADRLELPGGPSVTAAPRLDGPDAHQSPDADD